MAERDLGLSIPLHGVQLIEASAGTGKTFTVATLYARLVIEAALPVPSILAVTFTKAATAELRDRLRERLKLALRVAENETFAAVDGEVASVAELVTRAIEREGSSTLRRRLRIAVEAMDLAPIHTIHAFCQRALAEHAIDAGLPPGTRELLANERELRNEVATEFWRAHSRDLRGARTLDALWRGPRELADSLRDLLAVDALEPLPSDDGDDGSEEELQHRCEILARAWREHADEARRQLRRAWESGAVHRARSKDEAVDPVWLGLAQWLDAGFDDSRLHKNTVWFSAAELRAKAARGKESQVPASPLFEAIEAWVAARECCDRQRGRERLGLLHRLREFGRARLQALKHERGLLGYDDLIEGVAQALEGEQGDIFAARLQKQYRVALVDEFQDTDARQNAIFQRLFAKSAVHDPDDEAPRALFLIGDPKQAIYRFRGGDVMAYLTAAYQADERHSLDRNFRSRPLALHAVQSLFDRGGETAFAWPDIRFHAVQPGGVCLDEAFERGGRVAPALNVHLLASIDAKTPIGDVREQAARGCASSILDLLQDGAKGIAVRTGRRGERGPVRPGDIAVLVERNDEALLMRDALGALGVPSVVPGRESLYATAEAEELRRLFEALRAPGDEARLRAALATVLLGFDAPMLDALEADALAQRDWQDRFQQWRQRCERHGPLAVVNDWCAAQAARLVAMSDGERRLGNYLQLGEALQEASRAAGIDALIAELDRRIESADVDNEDELLRLESDAERVVVLTLHKSKGLEFEFVFLPFIATHGGPPRARRPPAVRYHDGQRRVLHLLGDDDTQTEELQRLELAEERAERLRLLYVALTRARLATWLFWGAAKQLEGTALAWLLHRDPDADRVLPIDAEALREDVEQWRAQAPDAIDVVDAAPIAPDAIYRRRDHARVPPARIAQRELSRDWWIYSYSLLASEQRGEEATLEERGAEDEIQAPAPIDLERSRFIGSRFGNSLHHALEHIDVQRWRDWIEDEPPDDQRGVLEDALRQEGFGGEQDVLDGTALLTLLVRNTVNVTLPEGIRLCDLPRAARRDEMEFHLGLAPTSLAQMLDLLHAHGVVTERRSFGLRRRIEGLLTGRIDLVYEHDGRCYVLDYKSNRLRDYGQEALAEAVQHSEYDLQYVLYTLALHRWLRFRLGAGYDYERDVGGVRYLFCRGLDAQSREGNGIHVAKPSAALIHALDALFSGAGARGAA